jgi:ribosomal protein S18 acetylase RimI-like enzyme
LTELSNFDCQVEISPATLRDLNQVKALEKLCFPIDAWPLLDLIGVLSLPNIVRLKATCNGKMVGFVAADVRRNQQIAWIATIGVLPEYRGFGIGQTLLAACEAEIPTPFIRLCVRASNTAAIQMYKRAGYSYAGNWQGYYQDGEDAMVMEKVRESGL